MYVFVRTDLPKSQQAVQAAHAAIESTKKWPYFGDHPHLVICGIKNEEKLKQILDTADIHGILGAEFYEDDVGMTAFATRPIISDKERRLFRKHELLRL
jgi:hypothetical protein